MPAPPLSPIPVAAGSSGDLHLKPAPAGTILVIDDEAMVRRVARVTLEKAGYAVLTAEDGAVGLDLLEQHQAIISLVLLDMGMPTMNGKEVLDRVRASGISVPIVVCSGYSEPEVLRQFAGSEFTAFIQKPFRAKELPDRVGKVLEHLAARR